MNRISIVAFCLSVLISGSVIAQDQAAPARADFVSDASFVVGTYGPAELSHTPQAITAAANSFLDSLTKEQREKCVGELKSRQRREWTNLPARKDADGVRLGELKGDQIKLACDLMGTLLSQQGYNKMRDIMLADDQLLKNGKARPGFGTENFAVVIFGTPSETKPWCFQLDGHHVGANVSVEGEKLTLSPSFIGTQPQAFTIAGTKYRPFAKETDLAHELAMSLTNEQIRSAVLQPNRGRLMTGPGNDGKTPTAKGVSCATFSDAQRTLLLDLISQWVGDLPESHATKRMEEIKSEMDEMKFSWNGNREPKSDVSYTIQSATLIIEYVCQDLGGDPLEHLHSIYRNPTNEYGGQID